MKKLLLPFLLLSFLLTPILSHAGENVGVVRHNDERDYVITFCSTGGDTVSGADFPVGGYVTLVETDPDGTAPPTTLWDLTITTAGGVDILGGTGANQSATSTYALRPYNSASGTYGDVFVSGTLTFTATNTGGGSWCARIYLRRERGN